MIQNVHEYIVELCPDVTFGQIQDEPDTLINMNIYDTGNNPFFKDDKTHIYNINLFIREACFNDMQILNENITKLLENIFDTTKRNIHFVNTKKTGSQDPFRDERNRYGIYSTFEMLVEEL